MFFRLPFHLTFNKWIVFFFFFNYHCYFAMCIRDGCARRNEIRHWIAVENSSMCSRFSVIYFKWIVVACSSTLIQTTDIRILHIFPFSKERRKKLTIYERIWIHLEREIVLQPLREHWKWKKKHFLTFSNQFVSTLSICHRLYCFRFGFFFVCVCRFVAFIICLAIYGRVQRVKHCTWYIYIQACAHLLMRNYYMYCC